MADPFGALPPFARDYLSLVVDELCARFGLGRAEAIGRVQAAFAHWDFVGDPDASGHLGHELPEHWAASVYHGRDAR